MSSAAGPSNIRRTLSGDLASDDEPNVPYGASASIGRDRDEVKEDSDSDLTELDEGEGEMTVDVIVGRGEEILDSSSDGIAGEGDSEWGLEEGVEEAGSEDRSSDEEQDEGIELEGVEMEEAMDIDAAILVGEHADVMEHGVAQSHQEHPRKTATRDALKRMYMDVGSDLRKKAEELYPWVFDRLRACHDFDTTMRAGSDPSEANHTSAPSLFAVAPSALHPVSLSVIEIGGKRRSGFELVLAVGLNANPKLVDPMSQAALADGPLLVSDISNMSQGPARRSDKHGVYFLAKTGKYIVGRATVSTFRDRLEAGLYSKAKSVVAAFGRDGATQRERRQDCILIDLSPIDIYGPHVRWVTATLESTMIACFASNDATQGGLNTNLTDFNTQYGGRSFRNLKAIWEQIRTILEANPDLTLPPVDRFKPFFESSIEPTLKRNAHHENSGGVYGLIREITPLADTGKYPHFPPLRHDAFEFGRPILFTKGGKIIVNRQLTQLRVNAPVGHDLHPPIPDQVKKVLTGIPIRALLGFEQFLPELEIDMRTIARKENRMHKRLAQPIRRSTRDMEDD